MLNNFSSLPINKLECNIIPYGLYTLQRLLKLFSPEYLILNFKHRDLKQNELLPLKKIIKNSIYTNRLELWLENITLTKAELSCVLESLETSKNLNFFSIDIINAPLTNSCLYELLYFFQFPAFQYLSLENTNFSKKALNCLCNSIEYSNLNILRLIDMGESFSYEHFISLTKLVANRKLESLAVTDNQFLCDLNFICFSVLTGINNIVVEINNIKKISLHTATILNILNSMNNGTYIVN